MRRFLIPFICACVLTSLAARGAVHVGIVSIEEGARGAGDLLTASLSGRTNIALLERDEVDKTFRERSLAGTQRADITRLGQALQADGLVMLELVTTSQTTNLAVRLVSVNSGVVLDAAMYPFPIPEPARWSQVASGRLAPLLPKLQVQKERALPLSILNLHAAVGTPEGMVTERTLSTLLIHRLALEPEVFVLERKQLGRAEWEKTLALDESPFWSGGYLLEGVIDRDGAARDTISVNLQLMPPNHAAPISIDVSAPRRDLSAVVEVLAQKILAGLRRESKAASWDRESEAGRFEEEASWALRWNMWPEAYAAAESAWALGRHSEAVSTLQLQALLPQIVPDDIWITDAAHKFRRSNQGRQFDPVRNVAWTTNAPAPTDVKFALEAAGIYGGISRASETTWRTNGPWLELGSNVLAKISGVIRHQYLYGWRSGTLDADLPALRETARDLASLLPKERVRALLLLEGPYWQETPAATVRLFRHALGSDGFGEDRMLVFTRDAYDPFWISWSAGDRERGTREWDAFISDLLASTNRSERADGALLKLHEARFDPDIALATEQFFDATMDEQRLRFSTNVSFTALDCFDQVLRDKCGHPKTLRRTRLLDSWQSLNFARMKHYLQTARIHNVDRAGWPYARHVFTQEQAKELLPVVEDYIRRIGGDWMTAVRDHLVETAGKKTDEFDAFFAEPVFDPARFHKLFVEHTFTDAEASRLAYQVRAYANHVGWTPDLEAMDRRLFGMLAEIQKRATNEVVIAQTTVLKVTRRLRPTFTDDRGESLPIGMGPWLEHDGKLIMLGSHPSTGAVWPPVGDGAHPIEIDPQTGESRMLPQVISAGQHRFLAMKLQAAIGNQLFWIDGDSKMGVLELNSSEAREYPVDLPLFQAELVAAGKRLFICGADYIAEFSLGDHSASLLASQRRKPAANALDDWTGWTRKPKIWLDRSGAIFANVGGTNVWTYDSAKRSWNEWPFARGHEDFPWTLDFSGTFSQCDDERKWIDGASESILSFSREKLPRWPMPDDYPLTPGMSLGVSAQHCFDGTNLWILMPPSALSATPGQMSMAPLKDRDMTLLWFDPRWEMPVSIPLRFEGRTSSANGGPPGMVRGLGLTPIRDGLLFGPPFDLPGGGSDAWFLPWSELRQWAEENQPASRNLPRSEPERRRRFDLNGNGILDGEELRAMTADSAWREAQEKFECQRLLLTFDSDHDGKLNAEELKRVANFANGANFLPPMRQHMIAGGMRRWQPAQLLNEFDANHDQAVDEKEVTALYRGISMR